MRHSKQEAQLPQRKRASNIVLSYGAKSISMFNRLKACSSMSLLRYRPITNCDPQYMTSEITLHSFSVTSANVAINNISMKTTSFGLHFCSRHFRFTFNHLDVIGSKVTKFGEITHNKGH